MARAIWSGTISFGLLNVPVKLYSAVARRSIALREIRESDSARIKHRRVAEGTDEEVPYENIVKAYEITPGQLRAAEQGRDGGAGAGEDARDRGPGLRRHRGDRPDLLRQPLLPRPRRGRREGLLAARRGDGDARARSAIARFVFRNKEHLAAIRADDGVLTLTTMRFADEVVPPDELDDVLPDEKPKVAQEARSRWPSS